ncbi:hypothetical protein BJ684DRAFT_17147 [Piptocephalis cylindrospora]|uniref:Uncharacterized protein n=1 Tax=Piptocephalis cylindrospora TaxID=1907219 RepID=A0A4P9Y0Z7_9FUNG|nr:hypothetical protein BJ684DRAFT_17147 [Piptocephalis cylindrospora]|eukprot:RKP12354.1 hypothetical protein BJ684DRAFT_17147 [Piptocephalis cylindrospora]
MSTTHDHLEANQVWHADWNEPDRRDSVRWSASSIPRSPYIESVYGCVDRKYSDDQLSQAEIIDVQRATRQPVLRRRRSSVIPPPPSPSIRSGYCPRRHSLLDSMDGDASSITSFPHLPTSEHGPSPQSSLYQVSLGSGNAADTHSRGAALSDAQAYHPQDEADPSTWPRPTSGPYALRSRAISTAPGSFTSASSSANSSYSYTLSTPPDTTERKASHLTSLIDAMPQPGYRSVYGGEIREEDGIDALYHPAVLSGSATMDFLDTSMVSNKAIPVQMEYTQVHAVPDPSLSNNAVPPPTLSRNGWDEEETREHGRDARANTFRSQREASWYATSIGPTESSASSMTSQTFGSRKGRDELPIHTTPRTSPSISISISSTIAPVYPQDMRVNMAQDMEPIHNLSSSSATSCPPGPSPSINFSSLSSYMASKDPKAKESSVSQAQHPKFLEGRRSLRMHLGVALLIESVLCISLSTIVATIYSELQWVAYLLVGIFVILLCPIHGLRYRADLSTLQAQVQVETAFSRSDPSSITTVSDIPRSYSPTHSYISSMYTQNTQEVKHHSHDEVDSGCEEVDIEKGHGHPRQRRSSLASSTISYNTAGPEDDHARNSFPSSFRRNTEAALDAIHDLYLARIPLAASSKPE